MTSNRRFFGWPCVSALLWHNDRNIKHASELYYIIVLHKVMIVPSSTTHALRNAIGQTLLVVAQRQVSDLHLLLDIQHVTFFVHVDHSRHDGSEGRKTIALKGPRQRHYQALRRVRSLSQCAVAHVT